MDFGRGFLLYNISAIGGKNMKILFILLIFCTQAFSMNRSEIRSKIRDMVLDAGTSSSKQHWSSATFNAYIDLVIKEIAAITWCQKNSYELTISTNHGSPIYDLQSDVANIERVTIHDADTANNVSEKENCIALEETTLIALDAGIWETRFSTYSYNRHGKPTKYYTFQSTRIFLNMGFDPPTNTTYTVTIYYDEIPADMSSDTDTVTGTPFRGITQLEPYHFLICLRVASIFAAFDEKSALSKYYYLQYISLLKDATMSLNWKSNFSSSISGQRE